MFGINDQSEVKISTSSNYSEAIKIAVGNLKKDISMVLGCECEITESKDTDSGVTGDINIYCLDEMPENDDGLFDLLPKDGNGQYFKEGYALCEKEGALYIIGKDRRGTIYGIYELSGMLGVSPWYFWADVPVKKKNRFSLPDDFLFTDHPMVELRGIFLNDEEELESWAKLHTSDDTIGYETYSHIFELLLRLKANYIWPAMHVDYFNRDPRMPKLADTMGIIVGTSHCDMLLRSNQNEWKPWITKKGYVNAQYDYSFSEENSRIIDEYWEESVIDNKDYDVTYTIGMRGIHDSGFETKAIDEDKSLNEQQKFEKKKMLLEKIMNRQEEILHKHVEEPVEIFIPYKEVLQYYDNGLKVPENATLVWVDDNFGYVRRFPNEEEKKHPGGNGLYYHASYWAHPGMSYLLFNSEPLSQMQFELSKSWDEGIRKLWILNVGALKPLEIDISYFMHLSWNIGKKIDYSADTFLNNWLDENFSIDMKRAAKIYKECMQLIHVRRLELMDNDLFSQENGEAYFRLQKIKEYANEGREIYLKLPENERDSFYQMILFKLDMAAYINEVFYHSDKSRYLYDVFHDKACDEEIEEMKRADLLKRCVLYYYNKVVSSGKWDGIVTPESFLPPPMAMHPDARRYVKEEKDSSLKEKSSVNSGIVIHANEFDVENAVGFRCIKGIGLGSGDAICAYIKSGEEALIRADFVTDKPGAFEAELYRYMSLDQTGEISCIVCVDNGDSIELKSLCTDEWKPGWRENVLNDCEKMRFKLPYLEAGKHTIQISTKTRYFTFFKFAIYDNGWFYSYLGPEKYDAIDEIKLEADDFYAKYDKYIKPLPMLYAGKDFWDINRLFVKSDERSQENYGKARDTTILELTENDGKIYFDASLALRDNSEFYRSTSDETEGSWKHIYAESDGQNGIAMRLEGAKEYWDDSEKAPSLNYKINIKNPGKYYIWLLVKYNDNFDDACRFGVNGNKQPGAEQFGKGNLFTYSMQQRWNWHNIS
ncbi:MAG: glycosyl hydrolase 115 family protein, partial [Butyrivibrio sp.]|nr:glycosyl hydrolase 115 family protein [Butyrivibrio sp.]